MKQYTPEKLAAVSRYRRYVPTLPVEMRSDIEAALRKAGFTEVACDHHPSKPWITVIAKKAGPEG